MERLNQLQDQTVTLWQSLDRGKKILICTVLLVVFAALIALIFLGNEKSYSPLFKNLTDADAGEIIRELKEKGVEYQLTDEGHSIKVPSDRVYDLRMEFASSGLPSGGGIGFEIFDRSSFGATDFTQKINYQRALQTELARSIMSFDSVEFARVHLAIPEKRLYKEDDEPVKASVVLKLKGSLRLTEGQVQGIINLLAGAVEGLSAENITVLSDKGELLTLPGDSDIAASRRLTLTQFETVRAFERDLEVGITGILDRVFGPGMTVVKVNAELDFDEEETNSEIFEPVIQGNGLVRSEQRFEESERGGRAEASGVPGIESNMGPYGDYATYQSPESSTMGEYNRTESIINYELTKRVQYSRKAPGSIKRLHVAAMVNEKGLLPEDMERIEQIIRTAAGIDENRGDKITVASMPFIAAFSEDEIAELRMAEERILREESIRSWVRVLSPILLGLFALLTLLIFLRVMRRKALIGSPGLPESVITGVLQQAAANGLMAEAEEESELDEIIFTEDTKQIKKIREKIEEMAKEKPGDVAKLIQTWLSEE